MINYKRLNLENKAKSKNLIFRGVEHKTGDDYKLKIETFCIDQLNIAKEDLFINDAYPMGRPNSGV